MRKTKVKFILAIMTIVAIALLLSIRSPDDNTTVNIAVAAGGGFGGGGVSATIPHFDDGHGNIVRDEAAGASPVYITFNPAVSLHGYPQGTKFWEENYEGKFLWYSQVPPDKSKATTYDKDMSRMLENRQTSEGCSGWKLVPGAGCNLKLGANVPGTQDKVNYLGDQSGTTDIPKGNGEYNHYEWRYLGYSAEGIVIENPYFPADYPSETPGDVHRELYNWDYQPWSDDKGYTTPTNFDSNPELKVQMFALYFFDQNPEFRRSGKSLYEDSVYWSQYFTLKTDPRTSTGIATGWHTENGHRYYLSLIFKTPPRPNLRVTEYTVTDKETGEVMGKQTISATSNTDTKQVRQYFNQTLVRGKTYVFSAKITNMYVSGLNAHDTTYTPIQLEQYMAFDEDSHLDNVWTIPPEWLPDVMPTSRGITTIEYRDTRNFTKMNQQGNEVAWEWTVPLANNPDAPKHEVVTGVSIPQGFYNYGDNTYTNDDYGRLRFNIENDDIGVKNDAQFIDSNGNAVSAVVPNQTYGLKVRVYKAAGSATVGIAGDYNNPFAAVDVTFSDGQGNTITVTGTATESIVGEDGSVVVTIPNAFTPRDGTLKAEWKLNWKAWYFGQSTDASNDGPYSKEIHSNINISVQNFTVQPGAVFLPYGQSSSKQTLTFNFEVSNSNEENAPKKIPIIIRKDGYIIYQETVEIPPNLVYPISWIVPDITLTQGDHIYTVEANPAPHTFIEYVSGVSDPYADNKANYSTTVYPGQPAKYCDFVHTENNWTRIYNEHEWYGYRQWYTSCGLYGCYSYSWCVTTYSRYWTDYINQYESYKITHVYFRSKLTDDTEGGWIDILNKPGRIKAGYGFEMKVDVEYHTNTYTSSPKSWYSDCSGFSVNPSYSYVSAPSTLLVTMPFTDTSGNKVKYQLTSPSTSGTWDNLSQEYQMPMHNAFGMKNTREVFVNEDAKDGNYQIRIDTDPYFYGTYDKNSYVTSYQTYQMLCDSRTVTIQVVGADSDDVKSHITQ